MDRAGILGSLCFPSFPRFCGQMFCEAQGQGARAALRAGLQRLDDRRVVRHRAGSLHPADHHAAVGPARRPRARWSGARRKGATAFAFSENPEPLGLPTIHDPSRYWDPVMAAAQETCRWSCACTWARRRPCRTISSDTPPLANLTFGAVRTAGTHAGVALQRRASSGCPKLKIALSEGNIGWMPYFIERAEQVIDKQRHWAKASGTRVLRQQGRHRAGDGRPRPTSTCAPPFRDHIFGCFIEESSGLRCLDIIGEDNVMLETDYPHTDTTWPDCIGVAQEAARRSAGGDAVQDPARQRREAVPLHPCRAAGLGPRARVARLAPRELQADRPGGRPQW